MKLRPFPSRRPAPPMARGGFTLPELLVAVTLLVLLTGGIVTAHLFGLSMFHLTETKLSATDEARKAMGRLVEEVRTCKSTWIGNVKNGEFVAVLDGETQAGTGLLIYPGTNTANYIIYFVNPSDQTFRRTTSKPGSAQILAQSVADTTGFRGQDFSGTVLTNNQNNRVIHFNLEFYQARKFARVADRYKLETAVTRRVLD